MLDHEPVISEETFHHTFAPMDDDPVGNGTNPNATQDASYVPGGVTP